MKAHLSIHDISGKPARRIRAVAALGVCLFLIGCTAGGMTLRPDPELHPIGQAPSNFDTAFKQNQAALLDRKGPPDVALYNIGLILSHPSNPKKDQRKALHSFRTLVAEHPRSPFADQAKTWILVLEQQQKNAEEKQRLIEEKRALSREREMLSLERQKLNYASEKSQQLDLEIERRRRQSLSK